MKDISLYEGSNVLKTLLNIKKQTELDEAEADFDVIGNAAIGVTGITDDILFVVYTDRIRQIVHGVETDVTRIISARYATEFERGLYYGKLND